MKPVLLFDKDGTLIDTEKQYHTAWLEAFRAYGRPISEEQALELRSLGAPFQTQYIQSIAGEDADCGEIRSLRESEFQRLLEEQGLKLKPYARETLTALREHGYRMALVTASSLVRAEEELRKVGLYDAFEMILSARTVERGKPAPDVYAYACRQLSVAPEDTIVVEDSPNGVMAGVSCGCKVIMIPDLTEPDAELEKKLYRKIADLKELREYLIGLLEFS